MVAPQASPRPIIRLRRRQFTCVAQAVEALIELRSLYSEARSPDWSQKMKLGTSVDGGRTDSDHVARLYKVELEMFFERARARVHRLPRGAAKWNVWGYLRVLSPETHTYTDAARYHNASLPIPHSPDDRISDKTASAWCREVEGVIEEILL